MEQTPEKMKNIFSLIADKCEHFHNLQKSVDAEKVNGGSHFTEIQKTVQAALWYYEEKLPSGSGIDSGCTIVMDKSGADRIVLKVPYHHMDQNGYYDGWEDYYITITARINGDYNFSLKGRRKRDVEDHLLDLFYEVGQELLAEAEAESPYA